MILTSRQSSKSAGKEDSIAAEFLAELKTVHGNLLEAIAGLERITGEAAPDEGRLTEARWRISRASLARRMLWAKILGFLLPRVGERGTADLRGLQDGDIALLRSSTKHVARWTTPEVLADWPGYCEASRRMRGKMADLVDAEKGLLYPILEAVARGNEVA